MSFLGGLGLERTFLFKGGNATGLDQVYEWADLVSKHMPPTREEDKEDPGPPSLIMCGDFNITPWCSEYEPVTAALARDELACVDVSLDAWEATLGATDGNGNALERVFTQTSDHGADKTTDYIFANGSKPRRVWVDSFAAPDDVRKYYQQVSDHRAVIARWEW
jgi:endonuclease/exonuclease/phosphatase family metal-dependent hydrolase